MGFKMSPPFTIKDKLTSYLLENKILMGPDHRGGISIKGLAGSSKLLLFEQLLLSHGPGVVVTPDEASMETLGEEAMAFLGEDRVACFPVFTDRNMSISLNPRQAGMRMEVLRDLLDNNLSLVITPGNSLFQTLPNPEQLMKTKIDLHPGFSTELTSLVSQLVEFGYVRESMVERPGEISLRGGILDIFPYTGEAPHRIEFYGNEIDSIRTFDIESQRSINPSEKLTVVASPDVWNPSGQTLVDYFPESPWIFIEDWNIIKSNAEDRELHPETELSVDTVKNLLDERYTIYHYTLASPPDTDVLNIHAIPPLGRSPSAIMKQLKTWVSNKQTLCLLYDSPRQKQRILDFLDLDDNPVRNLYLLESALRAGFRLPDASLVVLTPSDILGHFHRHRPKRRFQVASKPIREMNALSKGDYVVHIDHGIGVYQGLKIITVAESERECLAIRYQDRDMLYVPVDHMRRVQKYTGREGRVPEISKLGNPLWEKTKARTKKSVEKIARELIQLYSARQSRPGYAFSPDTAWQNELESAFVYEETQDQLQAIRDVKKDMEQSVPMDRLICGDVGYGKTEVAVRAAFKSINDGKQVAVLVPTTILAQQHFQTFQERLSPFPVRVEMLSRFRRKKEQAHIVQQLKTGSVDIVIGTHRMLSRDVSFKDLGLLIIDEEQKFGVRHKERLKSFRETVDVLALSATPIPRTMNLSLVGIRDMSLINTPPRDRLSIHTEVLPFDESVVAEAIHRELNRQGQIFFVHNRIQSIHAVATMIERIVPDIRLAIAHGQMNERQLEKIMMEFVEHKYDCLVATMIVGSGLDMPHVNTLLVNRADRLGLSQLYQLRGRVGRSSQKAYAYLFTPPLNQLKPDAVKRLRTIEEFTELGAGFQIAMRDLEIRGAGNLLGYQQSGNIDAVGFELYTRLVSEAVEELKSGDDARRPKDKKTVCQAQIDEDAYFPDSYIHDESIRMTLYKRLSALSSEEERIRFREELHDRFGPPPKSAETLIALFGIQLQGSEKSIRQIRIESNKLRIFFDPVLPDTFENPEALSRFLHQISERSAVPVRFLTRQGLGLELVIPETDRLGFIKKWLQSWG